MALGVGGKVRLSLIVVLSAASLGQLGMGAHLIGRESQHLRETLMSIGLRMLRIAATQGELTQALLHAELGGVPGFAVAAYDHDGALMMVSRDDVAVPTQLDAGHRQAADARPGTPAFLEPYSIGHDNVAIMRLSAKRIGYLGLFDRWATRRITRALGEGLLGGIVLTVLVGASAFRVLRWGIERRLRQASLVADRIAEGQFDQPPPDLGDDEVGRLARRFRALAEKLHREESMRRRSFADWAHEISTPLTSVLGYLESLSMEELAADPELRRRYVRTAYEQAQALGALADDLSTLSQLDFEGLPLDRVRCDLGALAAQERAAATTEIVLEPMPAHLEVDGDPQRLGQVIRNLVSNAIRHSPPGTRIAIRGGRTATTVWLEVEDQGPGIAAEHLGHLGERFYRVDASRTRTTGGRGLGLAISLGIVESHGGRLSFRSELGVGTTVRLELPLPA